MNSQLKADKQIIRKFMADNYDNGHLTQLLDHLRAGRFQYYSCCCFIGLLNADHEGGELRSSCKLNDLAATHYSSALRRYGNEADSAMHSMGRPFDCGDEALRRARLTPMVLAEIRRRQRMTHSNVKEITVHEEKVSC